MIPQVSATSIPSLTEVSATRVGLLPWALALGGFVIGTVEFASMSLLPQFTAELGVSVPAGGQAISAYALGVVVGAPLLAMLGASTSKRALLALLMAAYAVGNWASACAPSFGWFVLFRFLTGLPHGTYFGVACVLAASLVPANKRAQATARVMLGLTVATIVGVPLATTLGRSVGWRWAFGLVAGLAALTSASVLLVAPRTPADAGAGWRRELGALTRRQVWLTLAIGAIGQGGLFSIYAYLASTLSQGMHAPAAVLPTALALFGVGLTVGLMICGWLADRALMPAIAGSLLWSMLAMSVYAASVGNVTAILAAVFLVGCGGGLVAPVQTRLMDVAGDAQTMAAALNHSAFNVANAIGPALGGVALSAGLGWSATGWVGVALALGGLGVWALALLDQRRRQPDRQILVVSSD